MKPIIAITPNLTKDESIFQLNTKYCEAIFSAGGLPIIISYEVQEFENIFNIAQGLMLTGGGDINPLLLGEQPIKKLSNISPLRDRAELDLCKKALDKNIPILGICRGCQILSVASGGTIYQDIYTQHITNMKHSQQAPKYCPTHTIELETSSKLMSIYENKILEVNSFHHQAVYTVGKDMIVSARSSDNIIEAIEHKTNKFAVGVQWHPELMFEKSRIHLKLFEKFINSV